MADLSIARRYAHAFMELAVEAGTVDALGADLAKVTELVTGYDNLLGSVLVNPGFTLEERQSVLGELLPKLGLDGLTNNLVRLLLERGRIGGIADITAEYQRLADERQGRLRAVVETATPLTPQLEAEVRVALEKATGKTVLVQTTVRPELIGGLIARVGSKVYDTSVQSRLENLKNALIRSQTPGQA